MQKKNTVFADAVRFGAAKIVRHICRTYDIRPSVKMIVSTGNEMLLDIFYYDLKLAIPSDAIITFIRQSNDSVWIKNKITWMCRKYGIPHTVAMANAAVLQEQQDLVEWFISRQVKPNMTISHYVADCHKRQKKIDVDHIQFLFEDAALKFGLNFFDCLFAQPTVNHISVVDIVKYAFSIGVKVAEYHIRMATANGDILAAAFIKNALVK